MIAAGSAGDFIALGDTEPVEFMLYLYFGKTEDDLKNFALRDLGIIRTNKNANLSARFTDEAEARACFHYSRLLGQLETNSEEVYRSALTAMLAGPQCATDCASDLRNKAAPVRFLDPPMAAFAAPAGVERRLKRLVVHAFRQGPG
jgi:DNA polymerase III subunit epsilon